MKKNTFLQIHRNKVDWWLETKAKVILSILTTTFEDKDVTILDIGSGTGFLASYVREHGYNKITVSDRSKTALNLLNKQFDSVISINLPNKPNLRKKYHCILLLDVMEHIRDDYSTLENLKKLLKPNGVIIITVPAFEFLWSQKDIRVEHMRRYTFKTLKRVIQIAKLNIEYITYYNFFLFFPAILYSLVNKRNEKISRYKSMPHKMFKNIFQLEVPFIINKFKFPFGVSLLAIVRNEK